MKKIFITSFCRENMNSIAFNMWIEPLQLIKVEPDRVIISAPGFKIDLIMSKYKSFIEDAFYNAMENAYYLFGDRAFRKSNYINKALFLSWSRVLCDLSTSKLKVNNINNKLLNHLEDEIKTNSEYNNALSMATNDVRNVELSYAVAKRLLNEVCK